MKNTLILTGIAAHLQQQLQQEFGQNTYFLTALGTVFALEPETGYGDALVDLVLRNQITEVYLVQDTSCPVLTHALNPSSGMETCAHNFLQQLAKDHSAEILQHPTLAGQKKCLAQLNLYRQAEQLRRLPGFSALLTQGKVALQVRVTDQAPVRATFELQPQT
ncbi:hypothetical protein [Rufibacter ruber]|uniref:hypothetical protein n=1 Tax=Rufibacter ruber TaxID=1783499 RepID=UPI0008364E0C|nr:hypothetical protein [Rufibacter ruber]